MRLIASILFLTVAYTASAACDRPPAPTLPDGNTSDLEAMVEGQKAVQTYVTATEAYLECLNAESEAAAETDTPEQQMARIEQYNKVVDEMEALAGAFNEEIREYKAQSQ